MQGYPMLTAPAARPCLAEIPEEIGQALRGEWHIALREQHAQRGHGQWLRQGQGDQLVGQLAPMIRSFLMKAAPAAA